MNRIKKSIKIIYLSIFLGAIPVRAQKIDKIWGGAKGADGLEACIKNLIEKVATNSYLNSERTIVITKVSADPADRFSYIFSGYDQDPENPIRGFIYKPAYQPYTLSNEQGISCRINPSLFNQKTVLLQIHSTGGVLMEIKGTYDPLPSRL